MFNFTAGTDYFIGDNVTYECEAGFILSGTNQPHANCTFASDSGWEFFDNEPKCILPSCDSLAEPLNSYFNVSKNETGGVATYSCLYGYNPTVATDLFVKTCKTGGKWEPEGDVKCSSK